MTCARKSVVCLSDTPYYHVNARCVRRAWLWGVDAYAGRDYSHRKAWVIERMRELQHAFAVDVCAYAVMSNHYHLVLYVDAERARHWTDEEVIKRWKRLFASRALVDRYFSGETTSLAEKEAALAMVALWRSRLSDVSWYMRCLNEHLARRANEEDGCTGRFWEGRFRSQALLDEAGLLTAMAYVDLNPVRAGVADTPEDSEFTSIRARIQAFAHHKDSSPPHRATGVRLRRLGTGALPFTQKDYLQLIDWSGRAIRNDRRGHIAQHLPPILARLNIDAVAWREIMQPEGNRFGRALGQLDHLRLHAHALGQRWIRGTQLCERLYRCS